MEPLSNFFHFFIHLDDHLTWVIQNFGSWTYLILFLILFCETGLVVTPILPGDSLLFTAGALAANGFIKVERLFILLAIAAIAGDTLNYWIGYLVGPKVFSKEGNVRFFKKEYLDRTHQFYERHGGKAIILARFIPIIRTFAPFVAGIGRMSYWKFIYYNVAGGILWISLFVFGGYWFGNLPIVRKNFSLIIMAIIFLSILPAVIEVTRSRSKTR